LRVRQVQRVAEMTNTILDFQTGYFLPLSSQIHEIAIGGFRYSNFYLPEMFIFLVNNALFLKLMKVYPMVVARLLPRN
jgi:hypothetical protein